MQQRMPFFFLFYELHHLHFWLPVHQRPEVFSFHSNCSLYFLFLISLNTYNLALSHKPKSKTVPFITSWFFASKLVNNFDICWNVLLRLFNLFFSFKLLIFVSSRFTSSPFTSPEFKLSEDSLPEHLPCASTKLENVPGERSLTVNTVPIGQAP